MLEAQEFKARWRPAGHNQPGAERREKKAVESAAGVEVGPSSAKMRREQIPAGLTGRKCIQCPVSEVR